MKYRERANRGDWVGQVPERRFRGRNRDENGDVNRFESAGPYSGRGPRNYFGADERICEEICERMRRHGYLDARAVTVEVEDGEVTLKGEVQNRQAKRLAGDIADSVTGVLDVHNRLQLWEKRGTPQRWVDKVGHSGIYPASDPEGAPDDSEAQGMASWGQGERGAKGYDDHGESELRIGRRDEERP